MANFTPNGSRFSGNVPTGSRANTEAYAASLVVKATAGTLLSLSGYNSGAKQFIQVHASATLPANTAIPIAILQVEAASNFYFEMTLSGLPCAAGIVVCNSSTGPTKTIGAADCYFTATYN